MESQIKCHIKLLKIFKIQTNCKNCSYKYFMFHMNLSHFRRTFVWVSLFILGELSMGSQ